MLMCFFVIRYLYSAVSLTLVREQRFIRIIYYLLLVAVLLLLLLIQLVLDNILSVRDRAESVGP